jgi:nitric oxide reductase NorE protein
MSSISRTNPGTPSRDHKPDMGMWLFILLDMSTFGLFFACFLWEMGKNRDAFIADASHLLVPLGLINTLVLLTSSYAVVRAVHATRERDAGAVLRHLSLSLGTAILFILIKASEYTLAVNAGHGLTSSSFFSFYFILTGIHLLHISIGSILLTAWRNKSARGEIASERWVESVAAYWHMVDLLWLVIFSLLYIGSNV